MLGTTRADTFNGPIRCTSDLTPVQCEKDYEYNTGQAIVTLFENGDVRASEVPAAFAANHGPFT